MSVLKFKDFLNEAKEINKKFICTFQTNLKSDYKKDFLTSKNNPLVGDSELVLIPSSVDVETLEGDVNKFTLKGKVNVKNLELSSFDLKKHFSYLIEFFFKNNYINIYVDNISIEIK